MLDLFQKFLGTEAGRSQSQTEAMVDLLLLGMYSDNLISLAESNFMQQESQQFTWQSGISFSGYLERTIPKVRITKGDPDQETEFLLDIAQRLGDAETKQTALNQLNSLLAADGVVQMEEAFVKQVKTAFKL